jgi:hypothetical protein
LLVERRLRPISAAATDWREAEVTLDHFLVDEPFQQVKRVARGTLSPHSDGYRQGSVRK